MATYRVESTPEERDAVLAALKTFTSTVSVNKIALTAKIGESRARNAIMDLEEANIIKRVPTKAFNKHFVRYRYEILQP